MDELPWTKAETLYMYAYIFKYPTASDKSIAVSLLHDGWITNRKEDALAERISYLRKHKDTIFIPK